MDLSPGRRKIRGCLRTFWLHDGASEKKLLFMGRISVSLSFPPGGTEKPSDWMLDFTITPFLGNSRPGLCQDLGISSKHFQTIPPPSIPVAQVGRVDYSCSGEVGGSCRRQALTSSPSPSVCIYNTKGKMSLVVCNFNRAAQKNRTIYGWACRTPAIRDLIF